MNRWILVALTALILASTPTASLGAVSSEPVIALHTVHKAWKGGFSCDFVNPEYLAGWGPRCEAYLTEFPLLSTAEVFVIAVDFDLTRGIAGVSCGIDYGPSLGLYSWSLCADFDSPAGDWPQPGGGNQIFWDPDTSCQQTVVQGQEVVAVAGSFYVYAYDLERFQLVPNAFATGGPEITVSDCAGTTRHLNATQVGEVVFSDDPLVKGFNPCADSVPVRRTSWGAVKALY